MYMCSKSYDLNFKDQTGFRFWDAAANKQLIPLRCCTSWV